ncbi:MAG: two-component system response regulator [Anaerolineaceae bacterium 4572_32.2]|nr:MAG: two-component system response regulator [Anaerolineaceae bacterium 4572_32.2]
MSTDKQATVLIVDDEFFNRLLLQDILKESSFRVVGEAAEGEEAIRLCQELQPDIVLMDVMMPGMDGIQVTKAVLRQNPQVRVIMCSTVSQQAQIAEALRAGAVDFIVKPIIPDKVRETLQKVWAK